ncbi:MAG TPA: MauE/DoxX family redox-associated membrane protein [Myxococcota bacterium]|jgi:hypothetical protein
MTAELDPALRAALRGALALLWLVAAQHKLRDPARFREALAGYQLVPASFVRAFAAALAALELGLGLALLLPGAGAAPALATAALLALYAFAIAANLARGRRSIDCGCGARPQPLGEELLARNAALVGIALLAALPASARALGWLDAVTMFGGAAALAALYAAVDAALANGVRSRAQRVRA